MTLPAPDWAEVVQDSSAGAAEPLVVRWDEALAATAPHDGWPVLLVATVGFDAPDGQPYGPEVARLDAFRAALERAVGDDGRLLAELTSGGEREHLVQLRSRAVVEAWRAAPPEGLGAYEVRVVLADDPAWRGLREVAGRLADGEPALDLP